MEEVLAKVSWVARRAKDHSHVIILFVVIPLLYIPDHPRIRVVFKHLEHRSQPISLNEDIIVQETEKGSGCMLGGEVVIVGKATPFGVVKDLVWGR